MKKSARLLLCASFLVVAVAPTFAQRPEGERGEGREGRGEGGPGRFMRAIPLMTALDTDKDGALSAEEIKNAAAALKALDKDGDGKISAEELRPQFATGEGGFRSTNPEEMVNRLMEMDKNKDGKLTKDELPERMAGMLTRGDADKDGALSKEEIQKMAAGMGGGRGERREGEGRREGAPPPPPAPSAAPTPAKVVLRRAAAFCRNESSPLSGETSNFSQFLP